MKRHGIVAFALALSLTAESSWAHHSGAMFDMSRTVTVSGIVEEFNWTNPHSSFKVRVSNQAGAEEIWAVEMGGPNNLVREGWKRTSLKPGDKVTVTMRPLRDGVPGGSYVGIILADGKSLGEGTKP